MRRRIVSVLLVLLLLLLVLNSCKVEVLRNGENINNMLYPYLEFTLSEDGSYYTAEIIENVRLEEVEIPEAIDNLGTSIPVLYFAGFKNAKDSLFLKRVVLETSKTIIKKEALKSAQNFNKLEIKKIEGNTTIPELPTIEKEGKEFLGWFIPGTDTKISSGDSINLSSLSIEPRWKEHDLVYHEGKEATCTEDGWTEYYTCKTCSYSTKKIIPKLGHNLNHHEEIKSTCTESGTRDYYECTRCGKYFSDREGIYEISEVVIPSLGHLLTIHFDREEANCIKEGHNEYWQCERCKGYFLSDDLNSSPVDLSDIVLQKTGHTYSKEWSHNEDGHYHVCSVCGAVEESSIKEHNFESKIVEEPTNEKSGIRKYTCTVCGYSYEKLIHPNGHNYTDENKWEKHEPTCTKEGFTRKYCSYSGCDYYEDVDYVDAKNHGNSEHYPENPATCTEKGNYEYWYCPDCGKYFLSIDKTTPVEEEKTIWKALDHEYGTAWEYDSSGHYHKCIRCDSKIDITSHTIDQKNAKTETQLSKATCTSPAIYYLSCICGYCPTNDSKTFTYGIALGHSLTIHKEKKEATCVSDGNIEYWECDRCHEFFRDKDGKDEIKNKEDVVLNATGIHTHSGTFESIGESGHKEVCSVCHETFGDIIAHTIKHLGGQDSTNHWDKCEYCDYKCNVKEHSFVNYGTDEVCSVCLYVKDKQHTQDGGFDIQPETKEPKGQITITKEEDGYRASFILDSDSKMTAIKWFVDNTEIAQTKECSFSTPDSRSYNILCVVFNDNLVTSYSKIVIGGNSD